MKKQWIAIALVFVLALTLCACSGSSTRLNMGTGGIGGRYYAVGTRLAQAMEADSYDLHVKTTAGSAANLRLLNKGFLDIAIVQSDTLLDAVNGTGVFAGEACTGIRELAKLYVEECQIVVRADSDIRTVADLRGKRVSVGEEESGVRQNAEQILLVNGMSLSSVDAQAMSFGDAADALEKGELDAFFCTAGVPTDAVAELAGRLPIRLLGLDEAAISHLTEDYPCYTACTIAAGAYPGQESVTTVGVNAVLVAGKDVDDKTAEAVLSALNSVSAD